MINLLIYYGFQNIEILQEEKNFNNSIFNIYSVYVPITKQNKIIYFDLINNKLYFFNEKFFNKNKEKLFDWDYMYNLSSI